MTMSGHAPLPRGRAAPAGPPMPQTRHADRGRSASAGTWCDRTSRPATPASALSRPRPGNSAERYRLTSRSLRAHGRCIQPKDARDKEPRALPRPRSDGRYHAELYNTIQPHSSLGNLTAVDHANLSTPASQRGCKAQMANRRYSSLMRNGVQVTEPFITGDQPEINLQGANTGPARDFISLLCDHVKARSVADRSRRRATVLLREPDSSAGSALNDRIARTSHSQVFAAAEAS
jgi:hypothetical protein